MNKQQIKKTIAIGLITTGVVTTGLVGGQIIINNSNKAHTIEGVEGLKNNFELQKSIVTGLQAEMKLNVLQVQAQSTTTVHHNNNKMGIFKNNSTITFTGNVDYSIDFSEITDQQVEVEGKAITLTLKEPQLGDVSLNEDLTTVQKDEGILNWIFEEHQLTQEEQLMLTKSVKEDIKMEALEEMEIAKEKATQQVESLINKLTKEEFQVKINFIK